MAIKGFREARSKVIEALLNGAYDHEDRPGEKNLLRAGVISREDVVELLRRCRGTQYNALPHPSLACDVHVFQPIHSEIRWYIKAYFLSDLLAESATDTIFISVHPSD